MSTVLSFPHCVNRLVFDTGQSYDCFRGRYEAEVPPAGERRPRTAYLMGSNAIGESIYRRIPAVGLYPPLRTLINVDTDDRTTSRSSSPAPCSPTPAWPISALAWTASSPVCPTHSASRQPGVFAPQTQSCAAMVSRIPRQAHTVSQ